MALATDGTAKNGVAPTQIPAISKISVQGFKSLAEDSSIDIRPLTVLAGANSSGKSSIMQPLLMMKQTLESISDPGALLLNGPNVKFTSVEQFLPIHIQSQAKNDLVVGIKSGSGEQIEFHFSEYEEHPHFDISQQIYRWASGRSLLLKNDMSQEQMRHALHEALSESSILEGIKPTDRAIMWQERCFLRLDVIRDAQNQQSAHFPLFNPGLYFARAITWTLHIPGLRGNPERSYQLSSSDPRHPGTLRYPGTFDNYFASVLYGWQLSDPAKIDELNQSLYELGLTSRVLVEKVNDVSLEIQVGRLTSDTSANVEQDMVSIADVGLGVSQILPVLTALLVAHPSQLVYLEQPEIHLHPRAQTALAQIIVDAANRGVRVVVETHSSLLLLAIQTLVAEGKLSTDKAILHWFERNDDGMTKITSSELDEAGAYGEWPVDFDDVSLNIQSRYLDAAESHYLAQ